MSKASIKLRALDALRNLPSPDCAIRDETGTLNHGQTSLEWAPVFPGTLKGSIGEVDVTDDMDGHLKDRSGWTVARINYLSGEIILAGRRAYSWPYRFDYFCDPNMVPPPQVELRLVSTPVHAIVRYGKPNAKIKSLSRPA